VSCGDGVQRAFFVGGKAVNQPRWRLGATEVDGEVQHAGLRSLVAVVARGGTGLTGHSTTLDVGDNGLVTETLRSTVAARPQLVLFDLDGTLTDSAQGIVSSFRHALGQVGAVVPDGDLAGRVVGPPMHHTLTEMGLGEHTDAAIAAYRADYTTRGWAMNRLFDGIAELLADLQAAGVRLAVATSKAEPTARRILAHFGLDGHFEVIAGASVDGTRATKSDVVAHALAQLHPLPDRVLMVGDRSHDVEGAAEHGIDTVVVGWGYGRADFDDPDAVSALAHVSTVADLREVLGV
jgi:phosphoglycolate phosphatase